MEFVVNLLGLARMRAIKRRMSWWACRC